MRRCANVQILLVAIVVILQSCSSNSGAGNQLKDGDTIFFPDTTEFKQSWKMEGQKMLSDLFAADTFYNQLGLDTFVLTYRHCDCPDWIDMAKVELDCKECSDFYIDPADPSLMLPDEFFVNDNAIRFYGVRIPEMGVPAYKESGNMQLPKWTIIRYYGYEVVRPYKVWAPRPKIYDDLNDTVELPLTVTIE